ncbi:MAG: hypothetical protein AB2792_21725 [Candidatus Thiodiazotropha sp.]
MPSTSQKTDTQRQLEEHVQSIARELDEGIKITSEGEYSYLIEAGEYDEGDHMSAYDYLSDVLDIEYIVSANKAYKSARLLVAFGGPNIWINLQTGKVEGYWWGDYAEAHFSRSGQLVEDIDQDLEELFGC